MGLFKGYQIFYNYIRPHQTLDGKTPAEQSGINLELGNDKWLNLIKQASQLSFSP